MKVIKTRLSTKLEHTLSLSTEERKWLDHAFACFGFLLPVGSHSLPEFIHMIGEYSCAVQTKALMFRLNQIAEHHSTHSARHALMVEP